MARPVCQPTSQRIKLTHYRLAKTSCKGDIKLLDKTSRKDGGVQLYVFYIGIYTERYGLTIKRLQTFFEL